MPVSIAQSVPSKDDGLLYDMCMIIYPIRNGFRIHPLIDKNSQWRCERSPQNDDRGDRATINARKESLKTVGMLPHTRRGPIVTTTTNANNYAEAACKFHLLHWATLNDALKECAEEDPRNPKIIRALGAGYTDVTVLSYNTPSIVQKFIKGYQNLLNSEAQATTFIEVCDL